MAPMDLPPGHGADPTSGVHPHEIPLRPFSRVLFGLSPTEVRQFLQEVAQALERATTELNNAVIERRVLESSLKEYQSRLEQLEQDLAAYREREAQIPRALVDAERAAEDVTRAARAEADRILHEARRTAEETLRAARESAVQALREARLSAEHLIQASRRAAAEHEREARLEAQWLMDEAQRVVSDLRQRAEEFLGRWREATTHLDRLASEYAEAAHTVARLRTEAQDLLPRMEEMLQNLTAKVPVPGPRPPAAGADRGRSPSGGAPGTGHRGDHRLSIPELSPDDQVPHGARPPPRGGGGPGPHLCRRGPPRGGPARTRLPGGPGPESAGGIPCDRRGGRPHLAQSPGGGRAGELGAGRLDQNRRRFSPLHPPECAFRLP